MKSIWRIIRFTGELWRFYVAVSLFSILVAAMTQVQPLLIRSAIDEITDLIKGGQANVAKVAVLAILVFATDVGQTFFSNIGGYLGDVLSARLKKLMGQRYFDHLLKLPQGYFDRELSGKIINRLNRGIDQIANFIRALSNNFLQFIFSSILSLAIIFIFSWQVGLMLLSLYPVFIGLTILSSPKWQRWQHEINAEQDKALGRFAEAVSQIKVVKSFLREPGELSLFKRRYASVVTKTRPQSRYWHRRDIYRRLVLNVIFLGVYVYIFVEAAMGNYTLGTMVLLILYANNIRLPLFSISFIIDQGQRAIANTKDYFEVMDEEPDIVDRPDAKPLKLTNGEIDFTSVDFSYERGQKVLAGVSFMLAPGSKTALVGESGEGKTTITSLLLRLYEVNGGAVTIDQQNISDLTQASLRANIGVVFQDSALFSGTIRENISYARPDASDEEVVASAKAANASEFIDKYAKGYDTEIGERGLKLSGGQKQRIAIARALLKNAPILILDEATSSLDSKSEQMVQEALEHLMKNRTTLIIAHRLSTIASVDQIITLKNGQVDEQGAPAMLAKSGGIYEQLLKLQNRHTEATDKKLKQYEIS
ncbi:MAG: ABC transporter ATP-binding protein [Candidatus Saccharimonadales bacterium]